MKELSKIEQEKLMLLFTDPVIWAKSHLITYDPVTKEHISWNARWYQVQMLRDRSKKKAYRCGRRTGEVTPLEM